MTDAELECLAQTWSEHCKHKIFNARIVYEDEGARARKSIPFSTATSRGPQKRSGNAWGRMTGASPFLWITPESSDSMKTTI